MDNKTKAKVLSILSASLLLSGCGKEHEKEEVIPTPQAYTQVFHLESDCYDVEEEVKSLNIITNETLLCNAFKVLRYIDKNNFERIVIVRTYSNFIVDENQKIIGYYYSMFDAFNGDYIYTTNVSDKSNVDVRSIYDGDVLAVLSYDKLSSLKKIAISKGMDEDYVNSVMPDFRDTDTISTLTIANYYVQLVNRNNRLYGKQYTLG